MDLLQLDSFLTLALKASFFIVLTVLLGKLVRRSAINYKKISLVLPAALIVKFILQASFFYIVMSNQTGFGKYLFEAGRYWDVLREISIDLTMIFILSAFVVGIFYVIQIVRPVVLRKDDLYLMWITSIAVGALNYVYPLLTMTLAMVVFLVVSVGAKIRSKSDNRRVVAPFIVFAGITIFIFDFFAKLAKLNLPF